MEFIINGTSYKVGVLNLKREIEFYEKYRMTTEDGVRHREVGGVYKNYVLLLGNVGEDVYDSMMEEFLKGEEYATVKIPDGKTGFIEFKAMFEGVSDQLISENNGVRRWDNLTVKFTAKEPLGVEA